MRAMDQAATDAPKPKRRVRREEYLTQKALAELLDKYVDTSRCFWTSLENRPISWLSGHLQRLRGCKSGLPDVMAIPLHLRPVFLEVKSKSGRLSKSQKEIRDHLVAMGCGWFMARSVRAAMVALKRSHVPFRKPYREPERLAAWEGPFGPEVTKFPCHPRTLQKRREARARRRERLRELGVVAPRREASAGCSDEERRVRAADNQRRWRERRRMAGLPVDVRRDTPERREYVRQAQARYRERLRQAKMAQQSVAAE
jgi:VRR-NUC domain-containing protein